jgi:hypothetical protein
MTIMLYNNTPPFHQNSRCFFQQSRNSLIMPIKGDKVESEPKRLVGKIVAMNHGCDLTFWFSRSGVLGELHTKSKQVSS